MEEKSTRSGTIDIDEALQVGSGHLGAAQQKCAQNEPEFVVSHTKTELQEFTFVVCGAPKTGKSTLINAIINKEVADISPGLNAGTKETKCYTLDGVSPAKTDEQTGEIQQEAQPFRINIWDTKGIKTWDSSIIDIVREKRPMCLIFCSSPGSFACDQFIRPLITECVNLKVFVALVCTNQWNDSDEKRAKVMEEYHDLLKTFSTKFVDEDGIRYYGTIGLSTMVNSVVYENKRLRIRKPKSGIGRLIYGIMKSLNEDQLLGWCYTLMENKDFWSSMQNQIQEFFAQNFTYGKSILWSISRYMTFSKK